MPYFYRPKAKRVIYYTPMRYIGLLSTMLLALCSWNPAKAQIQDPSAWTYSVQKTAEGHYDLQFRLQLKEGWHIWSLNPGGDGYQIIPSFTFAPGAAFKPEGKVSESGDPVTKVMEGIEGKVTYYSKSVTYTQKITARPGTVITGTHQYQICNDELCLPPADKAFTFTIP